MSDAALPVRRPLLPLPGFMPDAVSFALRLSLALLLAYLVSFAVQLDSASSAGVCVAIVMQPSPGMAVSKAFYRALGTVVGGAMALLIISIFPQDRTMLLAAVAVWLAACTYLASVLRDFRSYGAALAGYTVAIIAVGGIDSPNGALLVTLDRVAAILVGIVSVGFVNSIFIVDTAHERLGVELRRHLHDLRDFAFAALAGQGTPGGEDSLQRASDILALRTEANYATAELADGLRRARATQSMLAALLGMLAAIRVINRTLPLAGPAGPAPATRATLDLARQAIQDDKPLPPPDSLPMQPLDALLIERAAALAAEHRKAQAWLHAAATGIMAGTPPPVRLASDPDRVAGALNAIRVLIAVALGATFCVLGNDSQVTLLLIQQAALTALVGTQPNPSRAALGFPVALPIAALVAGIIAFLLLPDASGFLPFALAVGGGTFLLALASRHPKVAWLGAPLLLFFTLFLSPANTELFNFSTFLNTVFECAIAVGFVQLAFLLVLPVQPRRRLFRMADKVVRSLQQTLRHGGSANEAKLQLLTFDRLAQVLAWTRALRPTRHAALGRLDDFAELDLALRRAWSGLDEAELSDPGLAEAVRIGRDGLMRAEPGLLDRGVQALLSQLVTGDALAAVLRAVSGLHEARLLLERERRALHRYGILEH